MEKITIKNCGPIREAELLIKDYLVLIGPQAGGKSTVSKAVYFGKSLRDELFVYLRELAHDADPKKLKDHSSKTPLGRFAYILRERFDEIFSRAFVQSDLSIEYQFGEGIGVTIAPRIGLVNPQFTPEFVERFEEIVDVCQDAAERLNTMGRGFATAREIAEVDRMKRNVDSDIERFVNDLFNDDRDIFFVPAGRCVLATLTDQLGDLDRGRMDFTTGNFIKRVGFFKPFFDRGLGQLVREKIHEGLSLKEAARLKPAERLVHSILQGSYGFDQDIDKLYYEAERYVKLNFASSGQQEAVWMLLSIFSLMLEQIPAFLIVEEPEAHLYPEAQKLFIDLMGLFSYSQQNQWILTTHSPYILSALNNLLYAHRIGAKKPDEVAEVIDRRLWVDPERLQVFFVGDGGIRSIMDEELQLIKSEEIDSASATINDAYGKLFDLDED